MMTRDIFVYIAGPYSIGDTGQNVKNAIDQAEFFSKFEIATETDLFKFIPYVPHLTHFWHIICPHEIGFWYKYDLKWLKKCDVLFRLSGESKGADLEIQYAKENGLIIFTRIDELAKWVKECLIEK